MRVCHSCVTRARIRRLVVAARSRVGAGASRSATSSAIARSASRMLLRCTSVGCAVSTGDDVGLCQRRGDRRRRDAGAVQALEGHAPASLPAGRRRFVTRAAAHVVAVFGDVGQVREVAEGADHADRLVAPTGSSAGGRARGRRWRRASAGRPPTAGARARSARRPSCPSCSRITSPRMRPSSRMSSTSGLFFCAASPAPARRRRSLAAGLGRCRGARARAWWARGSCNRVTWSIDASARQPVTRGSHNRAASDRTQAHHRHAREPPGAVAGRARARAAARRTAACRSSCWA